MNSQKVQAPSNQDLNQQQGVENDARLKRPLAVRVLLFFLFPFFIIVYMLYGMVSRSIFYFGTVPCLVLYVWISPPRCSRDPKPTNVRLKTITILLLSPLLMVLGLLLGPFLYFYCEGDQLKASLDKWLLKIQYQ